MKKLRIIITEKGLETLNAFLEENYLNNYIAINEGDLYYKNILDYADMRMYLKDDVLLLTKEDISEDDEFVWIETMADMKRKNATYYSIILDTKTKTIKEFSNESGEVKLINSNLDSFEKIQYIEDLISENMLEQESEM